MSNSTECFFFHFIGRVHYRISHTCNELLDLRIGKNFELSNGHLRDRRKCLLWRFGRYGKEGGVIWQLFFRGGEIQHSYI